MTDGRKESAVIAAACFADGDRRTLVTLAYRAEETGRGVRFESSFKEEGVAPKDRLSRVMEGTVERSGLEVGGLRSTVLAGDPDALESMILEWTPSEGSVQVWSSGAIGVSPRSKG